MQAKIKDTLEIYVNRAYEICKGKSKTEVFKWKKFFLSYRNSLNCRWSFSLKTPKALCTKKMFLSLSHLGKK